MATKKTVINVAASSSMKSALEIAMEKTTRIIETPVENDNDLQNMELAMIMLQHQIHEKKMRLGLIPTVAIDGTVIEPALIPSQPFFKPTRDDRSNFLLDSDIPILGKGTYSKAKPVQAKAYTAPVDDFEEAPKAKKATTVKAESTQPKAGKLAFTDTFRDAVMEAFAQTEPGTRVEAHTVNADDPTSSKYRVHFELSHMGSTVVLERKASEAKAYKRFTVEIPLKGGKLDRNLIPAFAPKK